MRLVLSFPLISVLEALVPYLELSCMGEELFVQILPLKLLKLCVATVQCSCVLSFKGLRKNIHLGISWSSRWGVECGLPGGVDGFWVGSCYSSAKWYGKQNRTILNITPFVGVDKKLDDGVPSVVDAVVVALRIFQLQCNAVSSFESLVCLSQSCV